MASVAKNQGGSTTPETPTVVGSPGNYGDALDFEEDISDGEDEDAEGEARAASLQKRCPPVLRVIADRGHTNAMSSTDTTINLRRKRERRHRWSRPQSKRLRRRTLQKNNQPFPCLCQSDRGVRHTTYSPWKTKMSSSRDLYLAPRKWIGRGRRVVLLTNHGN